jgi:hypothetical protein
MRRSAPVLVRVAVTATRGGQRRRGRLDGTAVAIVPTHLGKVRGGDVRHRLTERVGGLGITRVARVLVVADAILFEVVA